MEKNMQIGEMIRLIRKSDRLSQADMAEGICTQAEISRIERNLTIPSSETLFKISERLGVDLNFFFETKNSSKLEYIKDTFFLIRHLVESQNYKEVAQILEAEKANPLLKKPICMQFILWHEGLLDYYLNKDFKKSMNTLKKALTIYQPGAHYTETQLQILMSIGNLYGEDNQIEEAFKHYEKCRCGFQKLTRGKSFKIQIKLLYNMVLTLNKVDKRQEASVLCQEGIDLCKEARSFYLLGEFYYQSATSLIRLNKKETAIDQLNKAIIVFDITENQPSKLHAKRNLDSLMATHI